MKLLIKLLPLIYMFIVSNAYGQSANLEKNYPTKYCDVKPKIDGFEIDSIWNRVKWGNGFKQRVPNDGAFPSNETQFKVLYDSDNLYILIRAFDDDPESIEKRMSRRDGSEGDYVAVSFDSYNDKRTGFTFAVSASGVKSDEIISQDGEGSDYTWDPVWEVQTSIDSLGWLAEMRIPFSQLRFNKKDKTWGFQVLRYYFKNAEKTYWSYFSREESGWVRHFGQLQGLNNIKNKKYVELKPYVLVSQHNYKSIEDDPFRQDGLDRSARIGLDGKWGLTKDFTLDFTINPDFGQVEVDPSEVNLTAFETYYTEKRPFFIEGQEITKYHISGGGDDYSSDNLFYSRRIGRPPQYHYGIAENEYADMPGNTSILGAVKITGKTKNGLSLGIIETVTAEEIGKIYNADTKNYDKITVEPLTNYFITRVQKDLNNSNTIIGGIFTSTNRLINEAYLNNLNTQAYTGGLDLTQYLKNKKYYLKLNFSFSHIKGNKEAVYLQQISSQRYFQRIDNTYTNFDSSRTSMTGHAGTIMFRRQGSSKLRWVGWVTWRSPEFETNDIGYLRHSDIISQVFWIGYSITEPFGIFRNLSLNLNQSSGWDFGYNYNYFGCNFNISTEFTNQWNFETGIDLNSSSVSNTLLRGGPSIKIPGNYKYNLSLMTDPRKRIQLSGNFNYEKGYDGYSERIGFDAELIFRLSDALKVSFIPSYYDFTNDLQYVSQTDDEYLFARTDRITTNLTLRCDFALTPNLTFQYYGSPFVSSANYSDPKIVSDAKASSYCDRFTSANLFGDFNMNDEDFNFREFRSNLVVRWEYKPGSLLYLVWTQNKMGVENTGSYNLGSDMKHLFNYYPDNVFLIKLSYMFSN